jgi:hypothetical protein
MNDISIKDNDSQQDNIKLANSQTKLDEIMEVDLEIEDDENDIDYNSDFENEFDKGTAKNYYESESDSENEEIWPVRDTHKHYVNVRNTMQKNENIFFFFKVGASDSASGHMTVNNIIEMELFSHNSLDAARDFRPNTQLLILILKDYHYNAEKIISKEDISKLSLIEDEIKVLVNESSHCYLVKRVH